MAHETNCRWERTTLKECSYRDTHHYCPHDDHACTCRKRVAADNNQPDCKNIIETDKNAASGRSTPKMPNTNEDLRAVSDKIWNAGAKLTHNQLDEILSEFVEAAERAKVEEVIETLASWEIDGASMDYTAELLRTKFLPPKA